MYEFVVSCINSFIRFISTKCMRWIENVVRTFFGIVRILLNIVEGLNCFEFSKKVIQYLNSWILVDVKCYLKAVVLNNLFDSCEDRVWNSRPLPLSIILGKRESKAWLMLSTKNINPKNIKFPTNQFHKPVDLHLQPWPQNSHLQ